RDDVDAPMAKTERLQYLEACADFFDRIGGKGDPQGIADPRPEQHAQANRRLYHAAAQAARLGDTDVQRRVGCLSQPLVGRDGQEDIGGLDRNLELVKVLVLQVLDVVERALDHG